MMQKSKSLRRLSVKDNSEEFQFVGQINVTVLQKEITRAEEIVLDIDKNCPA